MLLSTGGTIISAPANVAGGQGVKTILQAHLGNNMAATAFVAGNANTVYDTIGTGNWKFYAAATTSVAAITSSSASSEWTGGSLLSYVVPDITSNLTMWYTMNADKNSSTTIYDSNGGPNATLMNSASIVSNDITPGPGNGYLSLNAASSQYVTLPSFTPTANGFSISMWFSCLNSSVYSVFFDIGNGQDNQTILMQLTNTGDLALYIRNATNIISVQNVTDVSVNDGVWRHVVWTMTMNGTYTIYLNGVQRKTGSIGFSVSTNSRNTNKIGASAWETPGYLNGKIDDFRIYQRILTPTDISTLYSLPTIYYPFETSQVSGTNVGEYSTGESVLNGTLSNGATIAVDAGSRVSGKGYLSLVRSSGQYFRFRPINVTNSGLTIALWFRATSSNTTGSHRLFDMRHSEISIQIGSSLDFIATTGSLTYGLSVINNNTWRHLVITIEYGGASGASSIYKMYINGNLETSVTRTFAYPALGLRTSYNLGTFGNVGQVNGSESFDGGIDDFRIYQRPISQAEVTDIYGGTTVAKITDSVTGATWMPRPETPVDASETGLYTMKSNEIALIPGTNSTYAIWTAPKSTNLKIDVSFADYHSLSSKGVGFQMFKINNNDTFGSTLFNRTVTSTALTNANSSNYLTVPQINLSVVAGDKVVYRIDGNGNPTSASSVLATTIYSDTNYIPVPRSYNPNETKFLQAHLGNNMAAKTFVAGNANTVYDTVGTGNWKFYAAATTSVAAITSASASSEWTGGSLLSYPAPPNDYMVYFPFETADVVGSTVLDRATGLYSGTLVNGTISNANARVIGQGVLNTDSNNYFKFAPSNITIESGISIAFWLRIAASPNASLILDIRGSSTIISIQSSGAQQLYVKTNPGGGASPAIPFAFDGAWHHIAVTISYISSGINGATYKIYKNGILLSTTSLTYINNWNIVGTTFNLGTFGDTNPNLTYHVNGSYDDFRVYNRVITASEVSAFSSTSPQLKSDTGATWMTTPAIVVDSSETGLYTVKTNEIALTPGTNSTYAIWTAPKSTNLKIDVSFADYHSLSSKGVGFQMFKINNDDTFGSTLFNRTVTSLALINGTSNYLTVPSINLSVTAGDKVVYRIDGNGNSTSASSVLATNIYSYTGPWS